MINQTQELTLDTVMGPRPVKAPAGWVFDKTAAIVWSRMLEARRKTNFKLARDKERNEAKIEVLALVLSATLGMAPFYWEEQARDYVAAEAVAA